MDIQVMEAMFYVFIGNSMLHDGIYFGQFQKYSTHDSH